MNLWNDGIDVAPFGRNIVKKRRRSADVFAFLFGESRPLFKGAWAAFLFAKLFL